MLVAPAARPIPWQVLRFSEGTAAAPSGGSFGGPPAQGEHRPTMAVRVA